MRPRSPLPWMLLLVLGTGACGRELPPSEPELRPVRVHRVERRGLETTRTFAGVARAGVESKLSFRVAGTVEAVAVKLGDEVQQGQILARLDATDYELKVEEAEAALAQAEAGLRRAEADYDRVRALYEASNASKADLDAGRAAAESGEALVSAARKQLEQARRLVGYAALRAPQKGAVAGVDVEVNESVRSGQPVFLLTSGDRPEVQVPVPEALIGRIRPGMQVTVSTPALPDRSFPATVSEVGVAATGSTATFDVTVLCDQGTEELRSGMAADVTFHFAAGKGSGLSVPGVALGQDAEGTFVYVVEPAGDGTGTVRRRAVTAKELAEQLEIVDGLEAGELVATAGVRRLTDGMRVKVLEESGGG